MKRIGLLSVMTLAALNIWTGAPLLAVWVGSRAVSTSQPTMGAIFLVVVVLAVACVALMYVLNTASAAYDALTGRPQAVRRHVPWLRSMRAEREVKRQTGVLGIVMAWSVSVALLLFGIWFFLFAEGGGI